MKALFIGRFQPFHNGHLKLIENISKKYEKIIIGIGSSQYKNSINNPFSSNERTEMINFTLKNRDIKNYEIVLIPDIHNPPKWVEHVKQIVSDFDLVITNNDFTKKLFLEKGFKVKQTDIYKKESYSGNLIRKRILNDDKWEDLVPIEVKKYIKKFKLDEKIKNINQ